MVKNIYIKTILYLLLIIMYLYTGSTRAQSFDDNQNKIKVGKKNPFAKLPKKKAEAQSSQKISVISDRDGVPELFVKAVTLSSLNAKSLKTAIGNLLSGYGIISVDEKSNSLIICDTKERLETILAQIHDIDKTATPIQQTTIQKEVASELVAESITPKFLNVKDLKAAIANMCSEQGSISIIEKSNSLVICDTRKNLEMILAEIKKIDKPTPGLLVETVTLKFLKAKNLKKAIDSMSSQYGSIATDDSTNSLIICDTRDKLEKILVEIRKADRTPEQIMIEVVILDVQLQDDTEIGVNWDSVFGSSADEQYTQALTTLATGATFSIVKTDISATLKALQEKRNVEILASPRVLVVSGHEAYIKTIEEIPYDEVITSTETGTTATGLTNVEFKEVGITLKVKATITDQNRIMMTIEPEQSIDAGTASTFSSSEVPKVDTRSAKTTLLMEDGQIVIMGGLRKKEKQITRNQVPLLGDLPLIGFLFASNKEVTKNSELIVMISPHIQNGNGLNDKEMKKFNELKNMPMLSLQKAYEKEELLSILSLEE